MNAANRTCSAYPPSQVDTYDVRTVVLNEMGHVNTLGHHVNSTTDPADRGKAVVQLIPVHYNDAYWKLWSLWTWDIGALITRFGMDTCTTPPCPLGAQP